MSDAKELFIRASETAPEAEAGQMFGKPCYKIGGKAFVCFFQDEMVFKLTGDTHARALALDGAQLFDPSGKGRAMKEWVQVPFTYRDQWTTLAGQAAAYVAG